WNLDPVDQINISNYAVLYNNPLFNKDQLGNCPECPKGTQKGQVYNSEGGAVYDYDGSDWKRRGGELPEVEVTDRAPLAKSLPFFGGQTKVLSNIAKGGAAVRS